MGLWPFGKAKADVELASRVVVLRARDAVPMRAKVTIKLVDPVTQTEADELAESCADLVRNLVREAPGAADVLGCEAAIVAEVTARLPKSTPPLRSLEVAGLHIIGDPGHLQNPAPEKPRSTQWLRSRAPMTGAPATAASHAADRLTPVHPSAAHPPVADRLTPVHPSAAHPPVADRLTPVQPLARRVPTQPVRPIKPEPTAAPPTMTSAAPRAAVHPPPPSATPEAPPVAAAEREPTAPPEPPHAPSPAAHAAPRKTSSTQIPAVHPPGGAVRRTTSSTQIPAVNPPGGAPIRRSSSTQIPAVRSTDEPSASSRSFGHLGPPSGSAHKSVPPPSAAAPSKRPSRPPEATLTARRRVVRARFPLPAGAGPYEIARALTPLLRDTAGRVLVAFLRAYDLTVVRRVPFDALEGDILASLTAPSDGAPGTYAASHAPEIHRWRDALGPALMARLQREANLAALALGHEMFVLEGLTEAVVHEVVDGLSGSAFGDPDMLADIDRYLRPERDTMSVEALTRMIDIAGEEMPPGLETALDPLFLSLANELSAAALIAKDAMEASA